MKTKLTLIIAVILAMFVGLVVYTQGVDNAKLRLVRLWGYVTLTNNPLLPSQDKDLLALKQPSAHAAQAIEPRVDLKEVLSGGPPKDGIPAIDRPRFVKASASPYPNTEKVIGITLNGEARAYPYSILNWHEIVNDKIGDTPITVTLCPLCDTIPVFIRKVNGQETTFGVSGKLYQSCLVMYDRKTDSLWAQPWGIAVAGPLTNRILKRIPAVKTTLGQWKKKYPNTRVLSTKTGHYRNYFRYPYGSYDTDTNLIFPIRNLNKLSHHPKEIESYIWQADAKTPKNHFSGASFHITHKEMKRINKKTIPFAGNQITVTWDKQLSTVRFYDSTGKEIPSSTAYAFIYPAFFETK